MCANLLTVVIPYAPAHADMVDRAVASVHSQSIACDVVTVFDKDRQGVAHARNEGVKQVTTPLVTFLDADDYLYPDFAQKMVGALKPHTYTYSDFHYGSKKDEYLVDDCINAFSGRRHTVTCVMRVDDFWAIGGFDTSFLKAEDVEFYQRAHYKGYCGLRVPEFLFHYTDDKPIKRHQLRDQTPAYIQKIRTMYQGVTTMGCCGDDNPRPNLIPTAINQTDVLVKANWVGNRKRTGRATRRSYPRGGNGSFMWVDPKDQAAEPNVFVLVENGETLIEPTLTVSAPAPVASPVPVIPDYSRFSRAELFGLLNDKGIEAEVSNRTTKDELIAILEAHHESTA